MPIELPNLTSEWIDKVFTVDKSNFEATALQIFRFQIQHNSLYAGYAAAVGKTLQNVNSLTKIPFLPIQFFKSKQVVTGHFEPAVVFESSGTTNTINSRHYVKDLGLYHQSFLNAFQDFYGSPSDYCILALLPSYLERKNSSLVLMADELIKQSQHPESGSYLYDHKKLHSILEQQEARGQQTLLIGVTFALLDFAEQYEMKLQHTLVMETGGMKGRREEWTRSQVQDFLKSRLGCATIHSEYGMTELLSQAYSSGAGIFYSPAWMKVLARNEDDPFDIALEGSGILNIIDLANIHSCSFIATDDAGNIFPDGGFEVNGRVDNADLRGCSLLAI